MFICAVNSLLEPEIQGFNRLYAYPNQPKIDDHNKIILDSGAFALSKSGGKMDHVYLSKLAIHYVKWGQQKNIYCIAPDVFKNPEKSIKQYADFRQKYPHVTIVPVLQFRTKNIDLFNVKKQINQYHQLSKSRMICISNNQFNPVKQSDEIKFLVEKIQLKFGAIWIHVLGAGYSHNNVKDWLKTGVNSIDSISYYTDAQHKLSWKLNSYQTQVSELEFKQLALKNAKVANEILQ